MVTGMERFWSKVVVGGPDDCWMWTANKTPAGGYGMFWLNGRSIGAHRMAYELEVGPIPEGLTIDHVCGVPGCVNPAHLAVATQRENILRSETNPAAVNSRKTHCLNGHPLSGENLHTLANGVRRCQTCYRERMKLWQRKWRAQRWTPTKPCPICGAEIESRKMGPHVSAHRAKERAALRRIGA
jgi:hypothetical protein